MSEFTLQTIAKQLEADIRTHRLFDVPVSWGDELIYPHYADLSLRNVPHTVASLLGAPLPPSAPLRDEIWGAEGVPDVERVVLFLMDGMGYMHLQQAIQDDEELRQIVQDLTGGRGFVPTTSIAPTTTAVALTTLWTGGAPAQTGMLGTGMYLREYWQIGNMLKFAPAVGKHMPNTFSQWGMEPADFVGMKGLAEHLAEHDIPTYMISDKMLWGTGLSKILHRGVQEGILHLGLNDMMLRLGDALRQTQGQRAYVAMYYHGVDSTAHFYGAHNRYTHHEIKQTLKGIRDVLADKSLRDGKTTFIITADHGHADVNHKIDVAEHPQGRLLRERMAMSLSGDNRLPIATIRDGQRQAIQDILQEHFADSATFIHSEDALFGGLYGIPADGIYEETRFRLGDMIFVPRQGTIFEDRSVFALDLVSWHGGLSDWEMITPFIWTSL
jgi:hypothetical protein